MRKQLNGLVSSFNSDKKSSKVKSITESNNPINITNTSSNNDNIVNINDKNKNTTNNPMIIDHELIKKQESVIKQQDITLQQIEEGVNRLQHKVSILFLVNTF